MQAMDIIILIRKAMPREDCIKDMVKSLTHSCVEFSWRGSQFLVNSDLNVDQIIDNIPVVTNESMLIEHILGEANHGQRG